VSILSIVLVALGGVVLLVSVIVLLGVLLGTRPSPHERGAARLATLRWGVAGAAGLLCLLIGLFPLLASIG